MKIKLSILFIFLIVFIHSNATIRRVGYTATIQAVNNIDYVNFQAAHDAASNNDTIQLYPGTSNSTTYTGTITKPLFILGVGYFTNSFYISGTEIANSNLQNLAGLINSCTFTVGVGSAGTVFQSINDLNITTATSVAALNTITINRCKDVDIVFDNSGNCDSWNIAQSYNVTITQTNASGSFTGNRTITNMVISNCLMGKYYCKSCCHCRFQVVMYLK